MAEKKYTVEEALSLLRNREIENLTTSNRNLLEENHRLRASEGRLLEEQGRVLGFFDLKAGDRKPRDIVWLIEKTVRDSQLEVRQAEIQMLERIAASIEAGQGMDSRVGAAVDKLRQASYDKGWNEGIDKLGKTLKVFFEALERRLR